MVEQKIVKQGRDASNARDDYALQQSVIASLSQQALLGGNLQQLFEDATRWARDALGVSHCKVMELQPDHETLIGRTDSGWEPETVPTIVAEAGTRSHAGYALLVNAPVIVTDFSTERRLHSSMAERWGLRSGVTVVIHGRGQPFGVLAVHDLQPRNFTDNEVNFLQSVANILGLAIEQNRTESELRDSERRFHDIFDSSHDAIVIATPEGRIVDANSAFSRIYGHSLEHALGKDTEALGLFANPKDCSRFARELAEHGTLRNFETDLRAADGRIIPTLLSSVMVDLGIGVQAVSILRDISERRAADLELARARDAALQSTRLKSAFLANTSHEIRTPLNVILGYTDLIGEHLANIGDHTQDAYLDALGRAGRRLLKTIQQILDYSRLEAGVVTLNPSAIALAPFIEDQASDFNLLAAEKGLELRLDIAESDATVRFDEYCLQSALNNLLQNAIKFTDRGEIVLGLDRDATGTLKLKVRDTGIGVDNDYLPRLFEPFSQEQTGHHRRFEGAGLGLAFARRCVELGGAQISAASRKGEGSTFTIAFPSTCEIRRRRP
jgi:PAS domain S-box-containing protein